MNESITVRDPARLVQYRYDKNGRLLTVTLPSSDIIHYEYDENGNLVSRRTISK
ncbi:MAG: RHS repeat protein [Gorillibacterium sp.]|nr:RHS repeat protein [Gorillibacterium sp.]